MIAAAGTGVLAINHEFLGGQARQMCLLVEKSGVGHQFVPVARRLHVDFQHAGIGRDAQLLKARIARRLIALDHHRKLHVSSRRFDCGHQFEIVLQAGHRRHEDVEHAVACLGTHGRAGDPGRRIEKAGRRVCGLARRPRRYRRAIVEPGPVIAGLVLRRLKQAGDFLVYRQAREGLGLVRLVNPRLVRGFGPG